MEQQHIAKERQLSNFYRDLLRILDDQDTLVLGSHRPKAVKQGERHFLT